VKRLVVVGGGPAGLYCALLAKKHFPGARVCVYEQNPRGATYGFGIVLADRGLWRFRKADRKSYEAIMAVSFVSRHRIVSHPEKSIFVEGGGYGGAIARLQLLNILSECCERAGVEIVYESRIEAFSELSDADLIVGADGINSVVRRTAEREFGTTQFHLTNRISWYGTTRHFHYPILSFKKNEFGYFVAAAYAYTERMSTFVPECDAETWQRSGLERMNDEQRREFAQNVFAEELQGHPLISNNSQWRCLPVIRNRNWSVDNRVLIGDALHSAHPTIGSGTRIAMEDAMALVEALVHCREDVAAGLAAFRRVREPQKQKLVDATEKSYTWYESFGKKIESHGPVEFVFDFLTRTGRVDYNRLLAEYPAFMQRYGAILNKKAARVEAT
jgi:2-polyprenyl-6-methoxyphenol hydroxylase-like FAD-dependent oxidoreductase